MSLPDKLISEFKVFDVVFNSTDLLEKLERMCRDYSLSPEDLSDEWMCFCFTNSYNSSQISLELLEKFENKIVSSHAKEDEGILVEERTSNSLGSFSKRDQVLENLDSVSTLLTFGDEGLKSQISSKFLEELSPPNPFHVDQMLGVGINNKFTYMFQKISSDSKALTQVFYELAEQIIQDHQIESVLDSEALARPQQTPFYIAGIISSSDSADASKFSASNITLFSPGKHFARSIHLNLSKLSSYSFFPGQVVCLYGSNAGADDFVVLEVFVAKLPKPYAVPSPPPAFLSVVAASFPCSRSNPTPFNNELLSKFLLYLTQARPHLCIVFAPFIPDSQDSQSQLHATQESFENTFQKYVHCLSSICDSVKHTKILIVSSHNDVISDCIYPTMPYNASAISGLNKNVLFLSDPCFFSINSLTFAVTSSDDLMTIAGNELSFNNTDDKLTRLYQHILAQRSFFPALSCSHLITRQSMSMPRCVEFEAWSNFARFPNNSSSPHVLICVSTFRHFIKSISGSVMINPGRSLSGFYTFAKLFVVPANTSDSFSIAKHLYAEIVKLH